MITEAAEESSEGVGLEVLDEAGDELALLVAVVAGVHETVHRALANHEVVL